MQSMKDFFDIWAVKLLLMFTLEKSIIWPLTPAAKIFANTNYISFLVDEKGPGPKKENKKRLRI